MEGEFALEGGRGLRRPTDARDEGEGVKSGGAAITGVVEGEEYRRWR